MSYMVALSKDALDILWAKTSREEQGGFLAGWLPLSAHLDDSGGVAGQLWDEWCPQGLKAHLAAGFPGGESGFRALLVFLAGSHDVGKATPAFQAAPGARQLADRVHEAGLLISRTAYIDRQLLPHGVAGQLIVQRWLAECFGWSGKAAMQLGVVIGGHHGIPPSHSGLRQAGGRKDLLGEGNWQEVQNGALERAARSAGALDRLRQWSTIQLSQSVQVLLSGLVIVADWIASNEFLFPHIDLESGDVGDSAVRLRRGWSRLQLPGPWRPAALESIDELFRTRFAFPQNATPHPIQAEALRLAETIDLPGLMIIESPMGSGKTEASLLAAEVLARRSGRGGVFYALPTQATSDAMFERVLQWLSQVDDAAVASKAGAAARSVMLMHGKAILNDTFRSLQFGSRPSAIAQDESFNPTRRGIKAVVAGWTVGRKKRVFADFAVGTIDQLLFTSLRSRHLVLRHLGMARKVVVIDEVHAYDAYMSVYLQVALEWLGAHGVPVVMLSATLPGSTRRKLISAYESGRVSASPRPTRPAEGWASKRKQVTAEVEVPDSHEVIYPAISVTHDGQAVTHAVEHIDGGLDVEVVPHRDDDQAIGALLGSLLVDGGCALVIRNTVARAQATAEHLAEIFGDDVSIIHSRFIGHHRAAKDRWLRERFGRSGESRPHRAIVVATQVAEQSLDVDFDVLVSDIAPVDVLLQRMGRMHRHAREARPLRVAQPRCYVTGIKEWGTSPPEPQPHFASVYEGYLVMRTASLVTRDGGICVWQLPGDIAHLVDELYETPLEQAADGIPRLTEAERQMQKNRKESQQKARYYLLKSPGAAGSPIVDWLNASIGEAEDQGSGLAQVRDTDDSIEVILLRADSHGQWRLPEGDFEYAGELVPEPVDKQLEQAIAGCSIRLPAAVCRGKRGDELIAFLERKYRHDWSRTSLLAGQLVLPISDDPTESVCGFRYTYESTAGLSVEKAE